MVLFSQEIIDIPAPDPVVVVAELARESPNQEIEHPNGQEAVSQPNSPEIVKPKATLRDIRAARSLLYNRLLLEVVQRRIENAEAIVLSYLVTQEGTSAQIGPYLVEVDAANDISVTKIGGNDGWKQPHFPELEPVPEA